MPVEIEPIESAVLRHTIENAILDSLKSGDLKPGDRIKENTIADQAGISRGPVREAIQYLVGEGILVSVPHKGTFVADWDDVDILETYTIRAILEGYGARLLAENLTPEIVEELDEIVQRMKDSAASGDSDTVYDLDIKFHQKAYSYSNHNLLCNLLKKMRRRLSFYIKMDSVTTPDLNDYAQNHQLLLDVITGGDPDQAEKYFREHIQAVGNALAERFRERKAESKHL